jgi:uncharacterized protein YceK
MRIANQKLVNLLVLIVLVTLSGCASPSFYQAAKQDQPIGYSEREVNEATIRIRYTAPYLTSFDQTYAYAIYRAAELAKAKGSPQFVIVEGPVNRAALARYIAGERPMQEVQTADVAEQRLRMDALHKTGRLSTPVLLEGTGIIIQRPITSPDPVFAFKPTVVELFVRTELRTDDDVKNVFDTDRILQNLKAKIQRTS